MASRRVRRDSETSTDSWSLVEEDRLDDDFSLNSTEAEEEYENDEVEPIVEEPPSSDEDTASEDSDCDSDSDSDLSENSELDDSASEISQSEEERQAEMAAEAVDSEEEEEEQEQEEEEEEVSEDEQEDSEDEEKSEDEEEEEEDEEEDQEEEEEEEGEMTEEEKKAARMCKEDEEWIDEEEEENDSMDSARHYLRVFLFISAFFLVFPIAEICTSWVLTYQSHRALPRPTLIFDYSPQRYNFENGRYARKVREGKRYAEGRKTTAARQIFTPLAEHLLKTTSTANSSWSEMHNIFVNFDKLRSVGKPIVIAPETKKSNNTIILPIWAQKVNTCSKSEQKPAKFLAPVPPAPFTPRNSYRSWTNLPRYQPCLVHVNESKWTCQKTTKKTTSLSVLPRKFGVSKRKIYKKKDLDGSNKKFFKQEICGKKASQSMRVSKPKDQCDSRHVSKYTPKRHLDFHRIEYKAPLPCQLPIYRPTLPKPSKKPSKSADDWFSRRGHVRAQLRSRA